MALKRGAAVHLDDPDALSGLLHDHYLNVDELGFDASRRKVSIPFYRDTGLNVLGWLLRRPARQERFVRLGLLEFLCVEHLEVIDTEEVGYYDLNKVRFESETGEIEVLTGCPVVIRMRASAFRARWLPE